MTFASPSPTLSEPWSSAVPRIAALLDALPRPPLAPVLLLLPAAQAQTAVLAAAAHLGANVVTMPAHSGQDGVAQAIARTRPFAVVCAPEVFGWVSKLAFLGGCLAIYTCDEEGSGTLLDRAAHCAPAPAATPSALPTWTILDAQGLPAA